MRRTIITLALLSVMPILAYSQGKSAVNADTGTDTTPAVIPLTKDERDTYAQFKAQDEKNNTAESKTVEVLDKVAEDNDAALLLAARLLKGTMEARKKIQGEYRAWLGKIQKSHDCIDCRVSPDGKSLIRIPVDKK